MKAYEAAKLLRVSNKEFLTEHNLKSHMSKVPPELEAELFGGEKKIQAGQEEAPTVDRAETVVATVDVEKAAIEQCPVDLETVRAGINGCGDKSCYWKWRHLIA